MNPILWYAVGRCSRHEDQATTTAVAETNGYPRAAPGHIAAMVTPIFVLPILTVIMVELIRQKIMRGKT